MTDMPAVLARVTGPDLVVRSGEAICVVGPNGCGKTSLLRALAGLSSPRPPASVQVAGGVGGVELLFQDALDGLVGLTVAGEFRVRGRRADLLAGMMDRDVATLSTGEARRVALALAEASDRALLLLDEPAEGLDAEGRERLRALVRLAKTRGAVVFVDPDGALAAEATRELVLGVSTRVAPAGFASPSAPGSLRFLAGPAAVTRGVRTLHLPALDLGPGVHALHGPNGCGKTTMLRRLAGLGPDSDPERPTGTPWLPPRARDLLTDDSVATCLRGAAPWVVEALVPAALLGRHPWTLSGGEAQRVALASVLGRDASAYLLDEPEAHLDGAGYDALCEVLRRRSDRVLLVATHDAGLVEAVTTRIFMDPEAGA